MATIGSLSAGPGVYGSSTSLVALVRAKQVYERTAEQLINALMPSVSQDTAQISPAGQAMIEAEQQQG